MTIDAQKLHNRSRDRNEDCLIVAMRFANPLLRVLSMVKATSGRLAPLNGHGFDRFVIMVCSELGLHRELANSVLSQFGVI